MKNYKKYGLLHDIFTFGNDIDKCKYIKILFNKFTIIITNFILFFVKLEILYVNHYILKRRLETTCKLTVKSIKQQ